MAEWQDTICYDEACNLEPWGTDLKPPDERTTEMPEGDWMKRSYDTPERERHLTWNAWTVVVCLSIALWIIVLALVF